MVSAESVRARPRSPPSARIWLDIVTPGRRGGMAAMTGMRVGSTIVRTTNSGPDQRRVKRQRPARKQREDRGGRRKRAAQIVEHLPAADCRNGAPPRRVAPVLRRRAAEDPRQQLPVAARPAVMARGADVVASREFLDDLDIGGEASAREHAFKQIVAEQRRVRRAPRERGLEGVDVIDALAGIGAFAEQILVDVGNGGGVRVDAAQAGKDALKQRPLPAESAAKA